MNILKRGRGRPKKNDSRSIVVSTKLNSDEIENMVFLMEELDMSMSEVLRYGLEKLGMDTKKSR